MQTSFTQTRLAPVQHKPSTNRSLIEPAWFSLVKKMGSIIGVRNRKDTRLATVLHKPSTNRSLYRAGLVFIHTDVTDSGLVPFDQKGKNFN